MDDQDTDRRRLAAELWQLRRALREADDAPEMAERIRLKRLIVLRRHRIARQYERLRQPVRAERPLR